MNIIDMNFEDDSFLNELDSGSTKQKVDLESIPFVNCGLYRCFITSAFKKFNENSGTVSISCTFVVYEDDISNHVGKFTGRFDLDPTSKFFIKTKEIAYLTGNTKGLEEHTFTANSNGMEYTTYPCLENKPIVVALYRKPEDYNEYPQYTIYGLFNEDKFSCREILRGIKNPSDVKQTYSFIKQKVEKDGGTFEKPAPIEKVEVVEAKTVEKSVVVPKEPELEMSDDELPF